MKTTTDHHDLRGLRRSLHAVGPDLRDRMRAALEDAGVTRQQWRILAALEHEPLTADAIDEAAKRRHRGRGADQAGADPSTHQRAAAAPGAEHERDDDHQHDHDREQGHRGHPFGGPGRFGRRGFGPGFGPFGRGFGPGFDRGFGPSFGPGFGPHAGRDGRRRPAGDVLDGLAERGWVQRADGDAADAVWSLTETGAAELERIRAKVAAVTAGLREGISDEEWDTAMSVLRRVAQNARR